MARFLPKGGQAPIAMQHTYTGMPIFIIDITILFKTVLFQKTSITKIHVNLVLIPDEATCRMRQQKST